MFCFILVLLHFSYAISNEDAKARGDQDGISFGNFVHHENQLLQGVNPLEKVNLESVFDCLVRCSTTTRCVSLNFNNTVNEKGFFECAMLEFDKFGNNTNLAGLNGIDHYSLASKCEQNPCKHNSRCVTVNSNMDYSCLCLPGTSGKHCQTKEFRDCAQRHAAGYKDSGVDEIKAPDGTTLKVFCSKVNTTSWTMVFKSVTGQASPLGPSGLWASSSLLENSVGLTGRAHYKNRLVEQWAAFKPTKVRLSLYNNSKEVLQLIFNGAGSDKNNWFAVGRVLSSPWTDLVSQPKNFFSIAGDPNNVRTFLINSEYPGCENDIGWLVCVGKNGCGWEQNIVLLTFLYSSLPTRVNWNHKDSRGSADMMVIYVQ